MCRFAFVLEGFYSVAPSILPIISENVGVDHTESESRRTDLAAFYRHVDEACAGSVAEEELVDPQHPYFSKTYFQSKIISFPGPTLRSYQRRAVNFMYRRETATEELQTIQYLTTNSFQLSDDLFYEPRAAAFFHKSVLERLSVERVCRGGVLADEMGLGKTVEILSLILSHPRTPWAPDRAKEVSLATEGEVALFFHAFVF